MKVAIRMTAWASLLVSLVLAGSCMALAQDASQQSPPAADNSKMNRQEDNKSGSTAERQKENKSDRETSR